MGDKRAKEYADEDLDEMPVIVDDNEEFISFD